MLFNEASIEGSLSFILYYDFKKEKFDYDDIMTKERTLRHMLKPNTWKEIEDMVLNAGFKTVEQSWRNHNFVGAIAIK